ncbi:hypothetical protein HJFPF1_12420 [Paramyrothecium foliicola]|nr:hypothetical protein HJFPF1_12420 [Paramyrothecium foliicola]
MDSPKQELQAIGRTVADTFKRLVEALRVEDQYASIPSRQRIAAEEERFQLWARTLDLFQTGRASLDYRVRDASFIKASLVELLVELQDHLKNLFEIAVGTRLPMERDGKARQAVEKGNDNSSSDETSLGSSPDSMGSFQEADFRLSAVTARLDSLYKLASQIHNALNWQQRLTKDLYKHVSETQRAEYIQNQEKIDSHQVIEKRGREDSIGKDLLEGRQAFLAAFAEDESGRGERSKHEMTSMKPKINSIENLSLDNDAIEFMVSTDDRLINVRRHGIAQRLRQAGGHISDQQWAIRDSRNNTQHQSGHTEHDSKDSASIPGDDAFSASSELVFSNRYGPGFAVTKPPADAGSSP